MGHSMHNLLPMVMLGIYVYLLSADSEAMRMKALQGDPTVYPIKNTSIYYPLAATMAYPLMVYFGRHLMMNTAAFEIRHWVFIYNIYQCILNAWTVIEMIREFATNPWYKCIYGVLPWGSKVQPGYAGFRMSWLVWIHYCNKYVELLDTLWMVLKKKNKQITFLHCYHHLLLIWVWWHCCSLESGGEAWFGACINSLIHVYMYGYYTMSLLKWKVEFMKIYMTTCQMLQFMVCLVHATFVYYQTTHGTVLKGYSPWQLSVDQAFVMVNMLYLFGNFFYKSYIAKRSGEGGVSGSDANIKSSSDNIRNRQKK